MASKVLANLSHSGMERPSAINELSTQEATCYSSNSNDMHFNSFAINLQNEVADFTVVPAENALLSEEM